MKTISGIFRAIAFCLVRTKQIAETPYRMKMARIMLCMWCFSAAAAAFALIGDALGAAADNGWWSWWYLFNGPLLVLDLIMVRAATVGYFYRKSQDADRAAFERIVADL